MTQLMDTGALLFRQCALAALRDVKSYLKDEGGQVAVSFPSNVAFFFLDKSLPDALPLPPRCLTPPTQPGKGGA